MIFGMRFYQLKRIINLVWGNNANDSYVINNEFIRLLNEYHYHKDFNIPLSDTLDNADAIKLSMFSIIKNEMELAIRHKTEKNGNSKS
jgi:hypothetical protein